MPTPLPQIEAPPLPDPSPGAPGGPRVYLETYGCQMNVSDSELIAGILVAAGYRMVTTPEEADVVLLNTCAVRENAEQRIVGRVGQLACLKEQRQVRIGIVGCMAQHLKEKALDELPRLDFIAGPDAYRSLPELIEDTTGERLALCQLDGNELYEGLPWLRDRADPTAFVTIMRGCDMMCTFCVVPITRGRERSRHWHEVVAEVEQQHRSGVKEVTLLGQTVNAYRDGEVGFGELLRRVSDTGVARIRFMSPHPVYFQPDEVTAIAERTNVCPWVHLPVQSGSTEVLERMRRGYSRDRYLELVRHFRERISDVALTTDIIVGFPGETEAQFEQTLQLMQTCAFDAAYMFKYSPREGTRAARIYPDDVPEQVKQERLERVIALQTENTLQAHKRLIGRTEEVLVTEQGRRGPQQWIGRTRGNKTVVFESEVMQRGALVEVLIEGTGAWTLRGRLIQKGPRPCGC